ncbi:MAG: hypothetical protein ACK5Q5_23955 [Planctomycetaceae bacterium]
MRARWSTLCLSLCFGASAAAYDVPPPPENNIVPQEIFNENTYAAPMADGSGTISPNSVYSAPATRYYSAPAEPTSFQFAGYNGGATMAIGGTIDELFNAGVHVVVETGWQYALGDGPISDIAFTIGMSNQTYFAKDQRSIILPNGSIRGLETLSISTVKFGTYAGTALGGIDCFVGVYGKVGAAVLNEDVEFFDPFTEYTPIQGLHQSAFAGGVGMEVGFALLERERSSLAFVSGAEYMYVGTFDNPSPSTQFFITSGLQWEFDITDGLFPDSNRCPRERTRRHRRSRR